MPAKINQTLTPLELEIMQVLWEVGPCTVAEVQPKLKAELAYTTVQTMLNVLLRKNKVKRVQEGRAYRYRPAVSRERASGSALSDLVKRMFGGSSEALLMAMVDTQADQRGGIGAGGEEVGRSRSSAPKGGAMMERALIEYVINALWQVPLLAGSAWLLLRMVRPAPLTQHRVWLAVLGLAVLLPLHGMGCG